MVTDERELFKIYKVVRQIADLAFNHWSLNMVQDPYWLIDHRDVSVNSTYNATTGGLFLEIYEVLPNSIWTPWGEWKPWDDGIGNYDLLEGFLSNFGLELDREQTDRSFGDIHQILEVRGFALPPAELRTPDGYTCAQLKESWEKMRIKFSIERSNC